MTRLYSIMLLLILGGVVNVYSQTAKASVDNFRIEGTEVLFDLYLQNTGGNPLYLTDCSFYWSFNGTLFNNPGSSMTSNLSGASYDATTTVYNTNPKTLGAEFIFLQTPNTTNTELVSTSAPGTLLGTVTVTGINDFTGTLNFSWGTGVFSPVVFAYDPNLGTDVEITVQPVAPPSPIYLGPQFEAVIKNQQLLGGEYTFDIFMKHTAGPDMHLDDSDIIINIPNLATKFSGPAFVVESRGDSKFDNFYNFSTQISGNNLRLIIEVPVSTTISNKTEFENKLVKISDVGEGTRIASLSVSNAQTGDVFAIDPDWNFAFPEETIIFRRRCQSPFNFSDNISDNGSYTVEAPQFSITLTYPNGGEQICPGTTATITWNSQNVASVDISLLSAGSTVANIATGVSGPAGSYNWSVPGNISSGNYRVRVKDANSSLFDDSNSDFQIPDLPSITDQPDDASDCVGGSVTLTVTAEGSNLSYQWLKDGQPLAGENSASLTLSNLAVGDAGDYTVEVSNVCQTLVSSVAVVSVLTPAAITTQPVDQTVTELGTAVFTVGASGSSLSYQWEYSANGVVFNPIAGATNATLTLTNVQLNQAGFYRVIVSGVCPPAVTSSAAELTVIPLFTQFDVTVYIAGYWNGNTHKRTPVAVELREGPALSTSASVALVSGMLSSSGTVSAQFPALPSGDYWLVIRHGGTLPVASNGRLTTTAGSTISYNFTDMADRAFPGAGVTVEFGGSGEYMLRGGDLNGDRSVSADDFVLYFLPNFGLSNPGQVPSLD